MTILRIPATTYIVLEQVENQDLNFKGVISRFEIFISTIILKT